MRGRTPAAKTDEALSLSLVVALHQHVRRSERWRRQSRVGPVRAILSLDLILKLAWRGGLSVGGVR